MSQKSRGCRNDAATRVTVRPIFHMSEGYRPDVQALTGRKDSGTMLMSGE